jgi:hypothetical protein
MQTLKKNEPKVELSDCFKSEFRLSVSFEELYA